MSKRIATEPLSCTCGKESRLEGAFAPHESLVFDYREGRFGRFPVLIVAFGIYRVWTKRCLYCGIEAEPEGGQYIMPMAHDGKEIRSIPFTGGQIRRDPR